jgi:transcriptional regulator with XRE-family HTH domain
MNITNLGKELRKLRLDLGITLFDMAKEIEMSSGMLSSVETGRKPAPITLVEKLANQYDVVRAQRDKFEKLALETKTEVRVRLDSRPHANELAVAFARKFDGLTDQDISDLMAVFEKKK